MNNVEANNPYQPPSSPQSEVEADREIPTRKLAARIALVVSVILAVGYQECAELFVLREPPIGFVVLLGTVLIAIVTTYLTLDLVAGPLCCVGATMAADMVALFRHGWMYADPMTMLMMSGAASLFALLVGFARRSRLSIRTH